MTFFSKPVLQTVFENQASRFRFLNISVPLLGFGTVTKSFFGYYLLSVISYIPFVFSHIIRFMI